MWSSETWVVLQRLDLQNPPRRSDPSGGDRRTPADPRPGAPHTADRSSIPEASGGRGRTHPARGTSPRQSSRCRFTSHLALLVSECGATTRTGLGFDLCRTETGSI